MGTSRFARAQMSACRLSSNSATAGGALFTLSVATSLVFDTRFDNNTASTQGGAFSLQATTASPSVVRCFGCSFRFVDRSISLGVGVGVGVGLKVIVILLLLVELELLLDDD